MSRLTDDQLAAIDKAKDLITRAMYEIESLPADVRLASASIHLSDAKQQISDFAS